MVTLLQSVVLVSMGLGAGWLFWHRGGEGRAAPPPAAAKSVSPVVLVETVVPAAGAPVVTAPHVDEPAAVRSVPAPEAQVTREPGALVPAVIYHVPKMHWEEENWRPNGNQLTGFYRTPLGSFRGYVDGWQSKEPAFYLIDPPPGLANHPHKPCFRPRGDGLYMVHFAETPTSVDAGILAIEKILMESLTTYAGRKQT